MREWIACGGNFKGQWGLQKHLARITGGLILDGIINLVALIDKRGMS